MLFSVPVVLCDLENQFNGCYFCQIKTAGFTKKIKQKMMCPNCESVIKPVLHDETTHLPPITTDTISFEDSDGRTETGENGTHFPVANISPHLFNQEKSDDL